MESQPTRKRDPLIAATCTIVILCGFGYAAEQVVEFVRSTKIATVDGGKVNVQNSAYANLTGAHFQFTNLGEVTAKSICFKGTLKGKTNGKTTSSFPLCTGEIKPRSSVQMEAPFRDTPVAEVCRAGDSGMNWDACDFETEQL